MYYKILIFLFFSISFLHSSQKELEKISLQLNWKYQFEYAGFIAAQEKGFYKEVGLDVNIKEFQENLNIVDELKNNQAEYAVYDLSLSYIYSVRDSVKLIANYFKRSPLVFVATQDIFTPEDLRGKVIMAEKMQLEESTLSTLFKKFNIKKDDYKFVQHSFHAADFINGNVDAISVYLSNELYDIKKSKKPYTIIDPLSYGIYGSGLNLFTSTNEIKNHLSRVKKFVDATTKGWEYAIKNKDEIINIIFDKYTKRKTKEALKFEADQIEKLFMINIYKIGEINKSLLQKNIHELANEGLIQKRFDINEIIIDLNDKKAEELDFTNEQKLYISVKKDIKMCIDPNWMPYEKIENGKHIGMTSDYIPMISKKIGIPITLVPTKDWAESIKFAKDRKCDIFSLAMPTPERLKYMRFTKPYVSFPLVLATKTDKLFITDVESLLTKEKIGIVKGYAIAELMKKRYPNNKIVDVKDVSDGMEKVNEGEIFGFLDALPTVAYELQHKYISELKIAGKLDDYLQLGIGVRNDDTILFELFEKAINSIDEETKQKILNKYISVKFEKGFDYELFYQILAGILVLLFLGVYRHFQLLKYNQKLKKKQYELNMTQKKLQASIKDSQILLDSVMEGIIILEENICIEVNSIILDMFGYKTKEEVLGKNITAFLDINEDIKKENNYEAKGIKKDKSLFTLLLKESYNTHREKKVKILSIIDTTEMKHKDKIFFQQSKMASMGQMLENIAHQWRQPLSVISTTATSLELKSQLDVLDKADQEKSLALINRTTQYLSQTIDDFRNFFKTDKEKVSFSILSAINKNLKLLEGMFEKYNIEIVFESDKDDAKIYNYENEFTQALINIFNNAKDALEKIETKRFIFINVIADKKNITIRIKDNGKGIDPLIINQIFDPYFTTKHKSQGTGIGLYMTHQIIENNMKGKISVQNTSGRYKNISYEGAEFTIILPLN